MNLIFQCLIKETLWFFTLREIVFIIFEKEVKINQEQWVRSNNEREDMILEEILEFDHKKSWDQVRIIQIFW